MIGYSPVFSYRNIVLGLCCLMLALTAASSGERQGARQRGDDRRSVRSAADLAIAKVDISSLIGDSRTLKIEGIAAVEVSNRGDDPADGTLTVTIFEDSNFTGRFEPGKDNVLGRTTAEGLEPGSWLTVDVPVSGKLRSRNHWISAVVSGDAVTDSNEGNNLLMSGRGYEFEPPAEGALNPVLEWAWTSSSVAPDALNVMMTPAVADLNEDGVPEVVFASTASKSGGKVEVGVLRALDGSDGTELFTVTDAAYAVNTASAVAIGDLDLDGSPEIVACDHSGRRLIAFGSDGSFRWRSVDLEPIYSGGPVLADLDGDGTLEIIVGRQVLDGSGALVWTGEGGRGAQAKPGPQSLVTDLDLDDRLEVLAGNTAYDSDGAILWKAPVPDGFDAVGNFDDDPFPEIVLVSHGQVRLLQHDGSSIWGPVRLPGGGSGGKPVVADFDADGESEIGVAGAKRYVVFETDGTVKWQAVTRDNSSGVTSSSVFDFGGDGSVEVVYRDELTLRVYRGADGTVLFQTPMSSCTWFEHVLIADVDADDDAEIVAVANDSCRFGSQRGVFVFRHAKDDWVAN